ncbi:MAG: Mth938-like domain-containing protein [Burkholderiales bacterium]
MKLHLARSDNQNTFTGYGEGYVMVNAVRYERSLVVLPDRPVETWAVSRVDTLREEDLEFLACLGVEIVLLGTGKSLRFVHPRLLQSLARGRVGVEVMDTPAACRTYNILVAEGRKVAAALIL